MKPPRSLWSALVAHADSQPSANALSDGAEISIAYGELLQTLERYIVALRKTEVGCLGILADNGPDWVLSDLAALALGIPVVPLPLFFSDAQLSHVIEVAGVDTLLSDDPERARRLAEGEPLPSPVGGLHAFIHHTPPVSRTDNYDKVSFTSGTTGDPKGVCLSRSAMARVVRSLIEATQIGPSDVHLCLTPLSVLLENLGGVYRSLWAGAHVVVPPLDHVGLAGSSQLNALRMQQALERFQASSAIAMPEMLKRLLEVMEHTGKTLPTMRFLGVGGANVPSPLLGRAERLQLPAFEGYGLTECSSVVALNTSRAKRNGSVGKPLSHIELRTASDGEVQVRGELCVGYLTDGGMQPAAITNDGYLATGDLGELDGDGFLYLRGRKNQRIITSFGRNVSPEWLEAELCGHEAIRQAAVFGDGLPSPQAVVVCTDQALAQVGEHVARINARLPDYARIGAWRSTAEPFSQENGQLTPSGQPRRDVIARIHGPDAATNDTTQEKTWASSRL